MASCVCVVPQRGPCVQRLRLALAASSRHISRRRVAEEGWAPPQQARTCRSRCDRRIAVAGIDGERAPILTGGRRREQTRAAVCHRATAARRWDRSTLETGATAACRRTHEASARKICLATASLNAVCSGSTRPFTAMSACGWLAQSPLRVPRESCAPRQLRPPAAKSLVELVCGGAADAQLPHLSTLQHCAFARAHVLSGSLSPISPAARLSARSVAARCLYSRASP